MNSFAILQKNQDKRPVRATPTPFHLSPKTLSGRLKRICHLAKHVKQVWHRCITPPIVKTLLFLWFFFIILFCCQTLDHSIIQLELGEQYVIQGVPKKVLSELLHWLCLNQMWLSFKSAFWTMAGLSPAIQKVPFLGHSVYWCCLLLPIVFCCLQHRYMHPQP